MTPSGSGRISEAAKQVARAAAAAFGGKPKVQRYYDAKEETSLDILNCVDRPAPGWMSLSTIGLYAERNTIDDRDVRVELAGVGPSGATRFANALGDMGLRVTKDDWLAAPGVVFPHVNGDAGLSTVLPHMFLAPPFPWPQLNGVQVESTPDVHWLLAVPISDSEYGWLLEHGYFAFERLFEDSGVEYFDLGRPTVV